MQIGEPINAALMAVVGAVKPPPPRFFMHFDADRDGAIDADHTGLAVWERGPGKRGAMFVCNVDDDDTSGNEDNVDAKINGGNDHDEVAPIVLRKVGATAAPGSWVGTLEVSTANAKRVRIFDGRGAGAAEVIGPAAGAKFTLPDLSFTDKELGIEGVFFAGEDGGWDGLVAVTFDVKDGGALISRQRGVLRVAPWMMMHHLDNPTKVFVVNNGPDAVMASGERSGNSGFRTALTAAVAGVPIVQHPSNDVWMQDCMEIGFTSVPNTHFPVATRAKRPRPLKTFPRTLLKPDFGFKAVVPTAGGSTFDSNGNLEVTPPCTSPAGKKFPLGRIYFGGTARPGEAFSPEVRTFLNKQTVQAPFSINTAWLAVGHVDEIVSFVKGSGAQGFKMLVASWRRAHAILKAQKALDPTTPMLVGREVPERDLMTFDFLGNQPVEVSVGDFLSTGISSLGSRGTFANLLAFNSRVQARLDAIVKQFKNRIGVVSADIIEVPIVYFANDGDPATADALTGGMVNTLVLGSTCIMAKAFGPVTAAGDLFENHVSAALSAAGASAKFVDDWYPYHVMQGEVHCGTNTLRDPSFKKWWEFQP